MIIGQDRTGKTSLKNSLKGEKFNPKEQSTEGIETDPEYFKVSTEIWRTGDSDKESEPFSEAYLEHHIARSVFGALKDVEKLQAKEETSQKQLLKEPSKRKPEASLKHSEVSAERYTFPFANEVPERVAKLVKELLLNTKKNEEKEELFSILWDFGGQSVYYATHPIFLTERAIYILTCDLSRDPYQKANIVVRKGLYKNKEDIYCNKTNLDNLDFWLSSVYSLVGPHADGQNISVSLDSPTILSPVFLVCTHADEPYCRNRDTRELALNIYGFLK